MESVLVLSAAVLVIAIEQNGKSDCLLRGLMLKESITITRRSTSTKRPITCIIQ